MLNTIKNRVITRQKKQSKKARDLLSEHGEESNTGSRSPSSVRKVEAGYNDTGKANNIQPLKNKTKGKDK